MKLLHSIKEGPTTNYDAPDVVLNYGLEHPDEALSFDGVYASVWEERVVLPRPRKEKNLLFVVGDHVGGNNAWDTGQPLEMFCSWWQLFDLVLRYDCELAWHTWSHPDLTQCSAKDLIHQVTPPFPMRHFAYPYGRYNARVIEAVKAAGFEEAYCLGRGDDSPYQRRRYHL